MASPVSGQAAYANAMLARSGASRPTTTASRPTATIDVAPRPTNELVRVSRPTATPQPTTTTELARAPGTERTDAMQVQQTQPTTEIAPAASPDGATAVGENGPAEQTPVEGAEHEKPDAAPGKPVAARNESDPYANASHAQDLASIVKAYYDAGMEVLGNRIAANNQRPTEGLETTPVPPAGADARAPHDAEGPQMGMAKRDVQPGDKPEPDARVTEHMQLREAVMNPSPDEMLERGLAGMDSSDPKSVMRSERMVMEAMKRGATPSGSQLADVIGQGRSPQLAKSMMEQVGVQQSLQLETGTGQTVAQMLKQPGNAKMSAQVGHELGVDFNRDQSLLARRGPRRGAQPLLEGNGPQTTALVQTRPHSMSMGMNNTPRMPAPS